MKCNNCGYDNEKGNAFCIKCGNKLESEYELMYAAAVKEMERAVSSDDYYYVKSLFNNIAEYKDSADKMTECENKAKELQAEEIYINANKLMHSATTRKEFLEAKTLFKAISEYKDSAEKAEECDTKAEEANLAHLEEVYTSALNTQSSDNPNEIDYAIKQLKSLHGYKDSEQLIIEYENKLTSLKEKQKCREEERKETVQKQEKQTQKRISIAIMSFVAVCAVIGIGIKIVNNTIPKETLENNSTTESISVLTETDISNDADGITQVKEISVSNTEPTVTDPYVITETEKDEPANDEYIKNIFSYSIEDDHVTILSYIGNETSVVIPDTIEDKPVEVIAESAFANTNVEMVSLPDCLKYIKSDAFANCSNLKNIDLSELGRCEIYSNAFCYSGLNDIKFPDDTSLISNYAFEKTPWKENVMNYDITETYDLDINYIMAHPFECMGRVYKFEADILEIYTDSTNLYHWGCTALAKDIQGYECMAVSLDKEKFDYFGNIDCYSKNSVIFYGLFTGKTATVRNYEWNLPIDVPYLSIVKIDGTENLRYIDQRHYNELDLDALIDKIDSIDSPYGISWADDDYVREDSWYSINMTVQDVSEPYYEGYGTQYIISGMIDSSEIQIRICEESSNDLAKSLIGNQYTFKALLVYGKHKYDTTYADYEFLFQADTLEEALN